MKQSEKLHKKYISIKQNCALVTAADKKYAPYLFNTLMSIHSKFLDHPRVYVFDLGMTWIQKKELSATPWVKLLPIENFIPHWKKNWSWKPYILTQIKERYVLYFDSANIVLYRPLELWYLSIKKHGYFVVSNSQALNDITPSNYWELFARDSVEDSHKATFGAGLVGFDSTGKAGAAIKKTLDFTLLGYNLGRSSQEKNRIYDNSVKHDCSCFRADQTLLNLAFRQYCGNNLIIRDELRYCGLGGASDHPNQYLWYSRKHMDSLVYYWTPLNNKHALYYYSRLVSYIKISVSIFGTFIIKFLKLALSRLF